MKAKNQNLLLALTVAVVVTLGLLGGAYLTSKSHEHVARVLYWQGYWLQSLVPAANIGTAEYPLYEANPVHVVAVFAGIPLGVAVYFLIAFAVLQFKRGGSVSPNQPLNAIAPKDGAPH
jgi:hypothetical protein